MCSIDIKNKLFYNECKIKQKEIFMKKILSLTLALCMMLSITAYADFSAFAGSFYDYELAFGVTQSGQMTDNDIYEYETSSYKFTLSSYTTLSLDYDSMIDTSYNQMIYIVKYSDYNDLKLGKTVQYYYVNHSETSNSYNHWLDDTISLYKGTYYLLITTASSGDSGRPRGLLKYSFSLTPTVNAVKNLKATSTASSIKLTWTGDLGSQGYQIQKKTSNGYTTVSSTKNTSVSISKLSAAKTYSFRIRGYVTVDNKKYYGAWKYLTAVTTPAKVSIKTPTTNKKHQITAKWSKVSGASGYQVQYCQNSSCSKVITTKTISGQSKTSYTGKNFTKGKKYYVRIRAYKTVDGKKYYGSWSTVKSIKCK